MNNKNAIKVEKLTKIYSKKSSNEIKALNNLNLEVKEGEIFGLLGPNGAGKTTTFYMIVGLVKPDTGSIILDKIDVSDLPIYIRGEKGISYLPQEPSIFRGMNVEDNIMSIIEIIEKDKSKFFSS